METKIISMAAEKILLTNISPGDILWINISTQIK